ncbi:hypothetical protein EPH95_00730 [Salicibibacter halophilus]|uniref:Uncharacterized protein n=1 Tax=Salicibibacter halophilus TaxID=2502791 RepID=A0A514LDG7_9BACI|nr:putative cytokinetic ring protein SteA [Salicibibacter halophilus]QDI89877.1 hypothetical protein EPH95_00730 [Salicibibacter halophilus]
MKIGSTEGKIHHLEFEWKVSYKGKIIVVNLEDLSELHLQQLLKKGIKAVVNGRTSMTGDFDHRGVERLLEAGVPVFDLQTSQDFPKLHQGRQARITKQSLYMRDGTGQWKRVAALKGYDPERVEKLKERAASLRADAFCRFFKKSSREAEAQLDVFSSLMAKAAATANGRRPLLIIAPTNDDERTLVFAKRYLKKINPFIIAIDGASPTARKTGFDPDVLLGNFTDIKREALTGGAQLVIPKTSDGKDQAAIARLQQSQLPYTTCDWFAGLEETALLYARSISNGTIFMLGGARSVEEAMIQGKADIGVQSLMQLWFGSDIVDLKGVAKVIERPSASRYRLDWLGRHQALMDGFKS